MARQGKKTEGLPQGVGTTSTGVHYDTRLDKKPTVHKPKKATGAKTARQTKLSRASRARLLRGIAAFGVIVCFAMVSVLFGDTLWDTALTAQPTEAPVPPSPSPTPDASAQAATVWVSTVWVPQSGSRYHKTYTCSGMQGAVEVALTQAQTDGFSACKRCNPPE